MAIRYRVVAACVVAQLDSETGEGYFYKDAVLPAAGSKRVKANHAWLAEQKLVESFDYAEEADESLPTGEAKPVDQMTLAELRDYAASNGVDLGSASKKDEVLAAILAVQA